MQHSPPLHHCGGNCIELNPEYAPYCPLNVPNGRIGWGCAYAPAPALALVEIVGRGDLLPGPTLTLDAPCA